MNYYVAGGIYGKEFKLVKPSGRNQLPYLATKPQGSLWRTTKHHAHIYHVAEDIKSLSLVVCNWEASNVLVSSPHKVELDFEQSISIRASIQRGIYHD